MIFTINNSKHKRAFRDELTNPYRWLSNVSTRDTVTIRI